MRLHLGDGPLTEWLRPARWWICRASNPIAKVSLMTAPPMARNGPTMADSISSDVLLKVRKLASIADVLRQGRSCEVTRLTSLKSLCRDASIANLFVTHLVRKSLKRVKHGDGRSKRLDQEKGRLHLRLIAEALEAMERPVGEAVDGRRELLCQIAGEQNEFKRIKSGPVRIIIDSDLLVVEHALRCTLAPDAAGQWAYQTARQYAERHGARYGHGLIPESLPFLQDIVDFWCEHFGIDRAVLATSPNESRKRASRLDATSRSPSAAAGKNKRNHAKFTLRQGQFLAFIHSYRRLHRRGPSESEMATFFRLTPPSVHSMVVKLAELGLIGREPGVARSTRVSIPEEEIPPLNETEGWPW
jgi:DNA-binding MarR family transcriptional regulator